jgi:hypothetical protein
MKRTILLLTFSLLALSSCSEEDSNPVTEQPDTEQSQNKDKVKIQAKYVGLDGMLIVKLNGTQPSNKFEDAWRNYSVPVKQGDKVSIRTQVNANPPAKPYRLPLSLNGVTDTIIGASFNVEYEIINIDNKLKLKRL